VPEGDTILRAARTLHRALAGRPVVRFESVLPALTRIHEDTPITGRSVESVTARGKHLLIRFSGGLVLHTHLRMNGSWHVYRPGERWQRPRRDMRLVVATREYEAVAFNVPVAEFLRDGPSTSPAASLRRQADLRKLGPDLLAEDFDPAEALRRMRERSTLTVGDALLNQRVVSGAGNVYRSEVLFLCRIHPQTRVGAVSDTALAEVLSAAQRLMRANVIDPQSTIVTYRGFRGTTGRANPGERLWVYGRARKPCRTCGTPIRVVRVGPYARVAYYCPRCQPAAATY
jgi:endonuclease VIII